MEYTFRDLIDTSALDHLFDKLYEVARIPSAIIDMEGNIITGAGWQRICTDFHRKNADAERICIASDTKISSDISAGKPYVIYECPHGLVDSCCPVILRGEHVANVFTGQMLHAPLNDEIRERFRRQAARYGFNEKDYLEALSEVPVFPIEKHKGILDLLSVIACQIAEMGLTSLSLNEKTRLARESEKRFRLVMDSLDALVYVADMETYEVLFINEYGRRLLGDITGRICWQSIQKGMTGPCDFCTNTFLLDEHGKPGEVYTWEFQNTLTDRWFLINDRAVEWVDGRTVRLEIATDISDRKGVEEEKRLLERQLHQAQKMEAVGTLAGGIAHDFNNILGIISGNAELASCSLPAGAPGRGEIEDILLAVQRAKDIVKQILSFSRRDRGKKKPYYLCRLVEENMKTLRAAIPSTVEIKVTVPAKCNEHVTDCRMVMVDPIQVHQLLLNLCTNAVQSMGERGILGVTLEEISVDGGSAPRQPALEPGIYEKLSVSDTGAGMDEAILQHIFDPFFTTKDPGAGTGMGLSVVHGIATNHGGAVFVESEPGEGTVFHVYFPAQEPGVLEPPFARERVLPTGSERILLIDDEALLADAGCRMLERLGYRVTPKTSSAAALEFFLSHYEEIDAVVTDQTMPLMTGAELAARILKVRPDMPVILCTGYSNLVSAEKAREIGIKRILMKPVDMDGIAAAVRDVLDEGGPD